MSGLVTFLAVVTSVLLVVALGFWSWGLVRSRPSPAVAKARNQERFANLRDRLLELAASEAIQGPVFDGLYRMLTMLATYPDQYRRAVTVIMTLPTTPEGTRRVPRRYPPETVAFILDVAAAFDGLCRDFDVTYAIVASIRDHARPHLPPGHDGHLPLWMHGRKQRTALVHQLRAARRRLEALALSSNPVTA